MIPTVFERNGLGHIVPEINPEAKFVITEPTIARRQYSGVTLNYTNDGWQFLAPGGWAAIFPSKSPLKLLKEALTRKPQENSPFVYVEEFSEAWLLFGEDFSGGLYELIGPGIEGNIDDMDKLYLVHHDDAEQLSDINMLELVGLEAKEAFELLQTALAPMRNDINGLAFTTEDGKVAQLKIADFDWTTND